MTLIISYQTKKNIELKHFKLWFSSVNILQRVLKNRIHVQSQLEKEIITEKIKYYVQNESYNESLKILKEHNFVIISGIPGIGKTTLARVIVFNLLFESEYEFINISNNIEDGFDLINDNSKQIFLFDDFLGRNFLKSSFTNQAEKGIVQFIKKVKKSKNKFLVFTTREYILKQAVHEFEELSQSISSIDKCIVSLASYTKKIKAKILYNHLFFNNVPLNHIKNLLDNDNIISAIEHRNYNPRLIDLFTNKTQWSKILPEKYGNTLMETLENPFAIWKTAYSFHISKISQIILKLTYSTGTPILLTELYNLAETYITAETSITENFDEIEFEKAINELEDSFIITKADDVDKIAVDFQNPSIKDFLFHHLEENKNALKKILEHSLFCNQFYLSFDYQEEKASTQNTKRHYLNFTEENSSNPFDGYLLKPVSTISLRKYEYLKRSQWERDWKTKPQKLYMLLTRGKNNRLVKDYVFKKLESYLKDLSVLRFHDCFYLYYMIEEFHSSLQFNVSEFILNMSKDAYSKSYLDDFMKFKEIYPEEFNTYLGTNRKELLDAIVESEVESMDDDNIESIKDTLEEIASEYEIDLSDKIEEIEEKITEKEESNENIIDSKIESLIEPLEDLFDDNDINLMFSNLLEEE